MLSQVSTLGSLSSLRIRKFRFKTIPDAEVFVGGFGNVTQAKLRISLFGPDLVIAVKKLRPEGNRAQRIRVVAVSALIQEGLYQYSPLSFSMYIFTWQALARELGVWHKLVHPNILQLQGFYVEEPSLEAAWIATSWQANGNFLKYANARPLSQRERLKLASTQ